MLCVSKYDEIGAVPTHMKGTQKHTGASLKYFDDHRCLSQSEEIEKPCLF